MSRTKKRKGKGKGVKTAKKKVTGKSLKSYLPWIGLIIAAAFFFMWPVIQSEFTELDDKYLILTGMERFIHRPMRVWSANLYTAHYKPLGMLSWLLEGQLFGFKSSVLHFNNLLLHAINSVLAFFVVLRLSSAFTPARANAELVALFSALLFAVHPLHVESVAWAIERKDVLYTCFFLLGLLAYFRYLDKPSMKWMLITTGCFGLSLLSKSPAIVFPAILILIDWAYDRPMKFARLTEKWPVLLMFVVGLVLFGVFGGTGATSVAATEGSIARVVSTKPVSDVFPLTVLPAFYAKIALIGLKGIFWYIHSYIPVGLSLAYPYRAWLPAIGHGIHVLPVLLALAAFFIWKRRDQGRFLFFTHAFFFIALSPALVRLGLGKGIFLSDRYVYIALLGLTFFVSSGLLSFMAKKNWPLRRQYIGIGVLVFLLGTLSFFQSRTWRNGQTLWSNVINKYPSIDYAFVNRAIWYKENNQPEKAIEDLNRAVALDQFDEHALIHRGTLLRQTGKNEQALADFDEVLRRSPGNEHAINGKANVLFELGRYAEAEQTYSEGLEVKPRMVALLVNRAAARYYLRKYREALVDLDKAEKISPRYGGIYPKRTVIYMALRDYENAVLSAKKVAEMEPGNHANYGDMGTALQNLGRHQEAIEAYSQAIRIYDRGAKYYRGRAKSYEALGNQQAAQQDLATADSL